MDIGFPRPADASEEGTVCVLETPDLMNDIRHNAEVHLKRTVIVIEICLRFSSASLLSSPRAKLTSSTNLRYPTPLLRTLQVPCWGIP